jgi:hypothetical protein
MWGSSIVNSSCRSFSPEKGSQLDVVGLYFEIWAVYVYDAKHQRLETTRDLASLTYRIIVDGIHLWGLSLIHSVM